MRNSPRDRNLSGECPSNLLAASAGWALVDADGIDLQPCCGTHVARSGEIDAPRIAKMDRKGRQNRRVRRTGFALAARCEMKKLLEQTWFRMLASAGVATVAILVVVGAAIRYYQPVEEDPMLEFEQVRILDLAENPSLAEAIRKEREKYAQQAEPEPPPPPPLPERRISGFVQVEYTINADGTVSDVRVLGAAPSGVYEERAVARVSRSMHAPAFNEAGEPVARRTTEIVEFNVPASELLESR